MKTRASPSSLHTVLGLKWNPFLPDVPTSALYRDARLESFLRRLEPLAAQGGYALVSGPVGSGKSGTLRMVQGALDEVADLRCAVLTRPHGSVNDFYRELGDLFGVTLNPCNRWGGAKLLRERWLAHVADSGQRAALLVDEAQSMREPVLQELRLLASHELDSVHLLTIVLAGDERLLEQLRGEDLLPLASRIRVRLLLAPRSLEELRAVLDHALEQCGAARLVTAEVKEALAAHAGGNLRSLMHLGAELLEAALERKLPSVDEKLFFEVFTDFAVARPERRERRAAR